MTASMQPIPFETQVAERMQRLIAQANVEIIDEKGHPVPPQEVVKRLPPGASIKWIPAAAFYGTAYFALLKDWEQNDPRWARVRSGEYPEKDARDIVQMFPRECRPADMAAYVEHRWGHRQADPLAEANRMIEEGMKLRQQAEAEAVDRAVQYADDHSRSETNHSLELRNNDGTANAQITMPRALTDAPKRLIEVVSR